MQMPINFLKSLDMIIMVKTAQMPSPPPNGGSSANKGLKKTSQKSKAKMPSLERNPKMLLVITYLNIS